MKQKDRDKAFNDGYEEGFNQAEEEFQDINMDEFAILAHSLGMNWRVSHERAGILLAKLSSKVSEDDLRLDPKK